MIDRRIVLIGMGTVVLGAARLGSAQSRPVPRVGIVGTGSGARALVDAFMEGLKDGGYVPGRNVVIEERMPDGRLERIPGLVDELVRLPVDVIFASGGRADQLIQ